MERERERERQWEGGGEDDRISELPDALRLLILSMMPLKSAIRTGAVSTRWRDMWQQRWPAPSSLRLQVPPGVVVTGDQLAAIDGRGRRRLDVFSLAFRPGQLSQADLKRCVDYAMTCGVEDLDLQLDSGPAAGGGRGGRGGSRRANVLTVQFPVGSTHLTRMSVQGLHLTASRTSVTHTLEVIHLHTVSITDAALRRVLAACPSLRELVLRCCRHLRRIDLTTAGAACLSTLTIVDCSRATELRLPVASRLRSFRFSGHFINTNLFSGISQRFEHLYLCSGGPETALPTANMPSVIPMLSNLTVLTICSIALQYVSASADGSIVEGNLLTLIELQLLMFGMANSNLADIFSFLKTCCCPRLKRLFVQLPTNTRDSFTRNFLEVAEEQPPEGELENLQLVKITNFKGHQNEVRLVEFLLRKASRLEKLFLVAPKENNTQEFRKVLPAVLPPFLKTQILLLQRASAYTEIIFSEHDGVGLQVQPLHSEVFVTF